MNPSARIIAWIAAIISSVLAVYQIGIGKGASMVAITFAILFPLLVVVGISLRAVWAFVDWTGKTAGKSGSFGKVALWFSISFVISFLVFRVMGERYHLEDDAWSLRDHWTGKLYYAKGGEWLGR